MSVSPELALAAAAAIRDQALEEQTKELIALRHSLHAAQEVEITGKMGTPVFCRGSFQDGSFRRPIGLLPPGVLWHVNLVEEESFKDGIPLAEFRPDMEIRVGGIVFATTGAVVGTKCRVRGAGSTDNRDDMFCPIHSGDKDSRYNRIAWIGINFNSLPEGPWKHLQSSAKFNSTVANDMKEDIFHKISHPTQFPRRLPNQTASVTSISFHGASVLNLIRNVHRDSKFQQIKEERIAEIEDLIAGFSAYYR